MAKFKLNNHELQTAFTAARGTYEAEWRVLDEILARACRERPNHTDRASVNAKLYLIGRSFASGIERLIKSNGDPGSAMKQLSDVVVRQGTEFDRSIGSLGPLSGADMSDDAFGMVLRVHGEVLQAIQPLLRDGRMARSFVSKYLHFHCDAVPIYDAVVIKNRSSFVGTREVLSAFERPQGSDEQYHKYVLCIRWLYGRLADLGAKPTVRVVEWMMSKKAPDWGIA